MERRVLIVDDNMGFLIGIKKILTAQGLAVTVADTVDGAREALEAASYDIVISDVKLSSDNGFEGLEVLRAARHLHPDVELMLITGYSVEEIRAVYPEIDGITFISKPVSPGVLTTSLTLLRTERRLARDCIC